MTDDYKNQLKRLLRNLFQFDSADLDFGIYRIMNKKRDEIERFIEKDLIDAVEAGFGEYSESKGANLKDEIVAIKAEIHENLGEDALDDSGELNQIYVSTPFAKKLAGRYGKVRAAMKDSDMSDQQEAEIFSHIYQFFSRYYDNGDFMSLRRYSQKEKYAIPYNGEEVVLHWANKDQYYIKTGENFKNYSFKMGEYTVEFLIREAEGTTNNNKAEKRFFVLVSNEPEYDAENKQLTIFFEYRGLSKDEEKEYGTRNVQEVIITGMKDDIPLQVQDSGLKGALNKVVDKSKDTEKTVLEKHLRAYTKKNTTDYFIHKDLEGFLTQELDFYIKNEVFHLDDLGTENEVSVEQYVSRVRVMKSICLKVIDFLAQIEDFQKMLFEKKKFVVKTDYCMTLDNVPEELYAEILGNEGQINEWKVLYGIGEEEQATITSFNKSIDETYLKNHPYLAIDTMFFDQGFKDKLLAEFTNFDEDINGLIVNSENWQALNLLREKYLDKLKCVYIDPPYNTGNDEFLYKDKYRHSSWMTMMENRLQMVKDLLNPFGFLFSSIDENEADNLTKLLDTIFPEKVGIIAVQNNPKGRGQDRHFATSHEYLVSVANNEEARLIGIPKTEDQLSLYLQEDEMGKYRWHELRNTHRQFNKETRPNLWYPLYVNTQFGTVNLNPQIGTEEVYPIWNDGFQGCWTWGRDLSRNQAHLLVGRFVSGSWKVYRKDYARQNGDIATFTPKTIWAEKGMRTDVGQQILDNVMGDRIFRSPKPIDLIKLVIQLSTNSSDYILDFFSGSGTTGHAVLDLNKENDGNRKYIMVEMGNYVDTIVKPRIQKVMYSDKWKDGRPQSTNGISHIFKYQTLEQYEDTLNNIEFTEAGTVQRTLADMDGYFLRYMLDFETGERSPCRFNVEKLTKPFDYTLKIAQGNELTEQTVDLVETFNYLLGIHVKQIRTFNNNGTYYRVVLGTKDEDDIAVIWRDTEDLDLKEDKTFIEGTILNEFNPTKTYINSDFYVEGAHPIEPEFKKLMVG